MAKINIYHLCKYVLIKYSFCKINIGLLNDKNNQVSDMIAYQITPKYIHINISKFECYNNYFIL